MKKETVLAIGGFDGVHLAHQKLLENVDICLIIEKNFNSPLIAFYDKESFIKNLGVKKVISLELVDIKDMTAYEFTSKYIIDEIYKKMNLDNLTVKVGFDFCMGCGKDADCDKLRELFLSLKDKGINLNLETVDKITIDDVEVSSTAIRTSLSRGDVKLAKKMLGREFAIKNTVEHGFNLASSLGFPTANQRLNVYTPRCGVYKSFTKIDDKTYKSITNIGIKPTLGQTIEPLAETYILDFSGDLYGKIITVSLLEYLREEKKFSDLDELKKQIQKDVESI